MKKKIAALLTAMLVMTMGASTVFAAGSPVTGTIEMPDTQEATVGGVTVAQEPVEEVVGATAAPADDTTVSAAVSVVENLLNNIEDLGNRMNNEAVEAAAADPNKKVSAEVKTVVELVPDEETKAKFENGEAVEITIKLDSIKAGMNFLILHYDEVKGIWETIAPTSIVDGAISGMFTSLSPVAVVEIIVEENGSGSTPTPAPAPTPDDTSTTPASPKTGETVPFAVFAAVICLAGFAVCGKKVKFN